jgi:hypothetical protein
MREMRDMFNSCMREFGHQTLCDFIKVQIEQKASEMNFACLLWTFRD